MKIAHLILAHKAPAQLGRLLRALAHPQARCFVHLDRKVDYQAFAELAQLPGVQFLRTRIDVRWGGYSLTQASLESMREVLQGTEQFDVFNVLSGEDYPIKPLGAIQAYFEQHAGHSFAEYDAPGSAWWQANGSRVTQYHFTEHSFPGRYAVEKLLARVLPSRQPPLPLYGGNMGGWYALSREAATYLLHYLDTHPELPRFARYSWGSDEFVVQSVLLNSPLASTVVNDNLRYIDWSGGGSSPKVLTSVDLPALLASPRLFARKFDATRDAAVLDALDRANGSATS
jgi:hypothetical protein